MTFRRSVPILRSFDEVKAREFYVDFLGFKVDFEHRFEEGMPLYLGLSKGECVVHVTEAGAPQYPSPESAGLRPIRIACRGLRSLIRRDHHPA